MLPQYARLDLIIQGDNRPVVDYNAGKTRLRDPQLFNLFNPITRLVFVNNRKITWKHIPREHNPVADGLANEAADAIIDGT